MSALNCEAIVANATDADLLASTGVSRFVFDTVFRQYCGELTPIRTRYDLYRACVTSLQWTSL
jgi:hypothetical protein